MKIQQEHWFSKEDVYNIIETPLLVLSDNVQSVVAARIKKLQRGSYNHLMYLTKKDGENVFVTQDATLQIADLDKYVDDRHRLKFWYNPDWTAKQKQIINNELFSELDRPWYKRLYDPIQIIGIRFGMRWLQLPGTFKICSDHADILKLVDERFNLEHPSPPEVNRWLKKHDEYKVYGRYTPD